MEVETREEEQPGEAMAAASAAAASSSRSRRRHHRLLGRRQPPLNSITFIPSAGEGCRRRRDGPRWFGCETELGVQSIVLRGSVGC